MRGVILICTLLVGCTINRPPEYESPAVAAVCAAKNGETVTVSYLGKTKQVRVNIVPSWDELYNICGKKTGGACVELETGLIHMVDDRRCEQHASHELGHVFGVPGLDAFHEIEQRRRDFYRR